MQKTRLSMASLLALMCVVGNNHAQAQSMDYGSLQDLFGEPVTTSATGTPQKASDAPANMTIITADEIRQTGSRSIPEVIGQRVAGMDLMRGGINVYDVGVRGYQQPFQSRLLVLVDGRQVFVDDYSRTLWDNLPVNIDDVRQIEVVKGASSALFGSNAAGGVINIVTYSPEYDHNNVASATLGTQHTYSGDGTVTFNGRWGGTKTTMGGMEANEFATSRVDGFDNPAIKPNHEYISNNSVFNLNENVKLTTEANYSASQGSTADFIDNGQIAGQKVASYSVGAGVVWNSPYGQITNNNYFNHTYVELIETPTDGGQPYGFQTQLFTSQLQDQFKFGADHTFRVGFEYKYKAFSNSGIQEVPQSPAVDVNNFAASGTWLWQAMPELSFTNAIRVDHQQLDQIGTILPQAFFPKDSFDRGLTALTANSEIVWKPTELDSFRAGYGRAVQMPSMLNYDFAQVYAFAPNSPGRSSLSISDYEGNPTIKPVYTQDYSLDYDRKVDPILSHIKTSVYYEINQNVINPFQSTGATLNYNGHSYPVSIPVNSGTSKGWGAEIEIKGSHPKGFRWDASYSYSRVADINDLGGSSGDYINYQGSAPRHHIRASLGYTIGAWELDGNGQYLTASHISRGQYDTSQVNTLTKPYLSLNGRIGYKINEAVTVAVSGTNLSRGVTNESPYPAIQRQAFLTLTGKF